MAKTALVFIFSLIVAGVAGYFALGYLKPPPVVEEAKSAGPTLEEEFQIVLNNFLRSIEEKVRDYRAQRKVLVEMTAPDNLRDPAYIEENYTMMQTLVPDLRARMDNMMQVFGAADAQVAALLEGQMPEKQQAINRQWQEFKSKQSGVYVDFLAAEDEIVSAYQDLVTFYYERRTAMSVDALSGTISFESPEDEALQRDRLMRIKLLSDQQAAVLDR